MLASGCRTADPRPVPSRLLVAIRGIGSLDPLANSTDDRSAGERLVARQVFEGLVAYDPRTLRPVPALASSWKSSPDARTFTFLLRDATFHNGREVTSVDVVWSLNRLARARCGSATDPTAGAPSYLLSVVVGYPEVAGSCKATALSGVSAVGPRTVMVSLSEPMADFPSAMANPAAAVLPEPREGEDLSLVGSGAYAVRTPWDGRHVELGAYDGYWGDAPEIAEVEAIGYTDDDAAYRDLLGGAVHHAPVPANRIAQARRRFGNAGFALGIGSYFFGFNLRSQRMTQLAFRLGLSRAVDRRSLATAVFNGTREPAAAFVSPVLPGALEGSCRAACRFDVEAARAKIAEAYPQGPPEITIGVSDVGGNPPVAEALAHMFSKAGVTARVIQRSLPDHARGLGAGDTDLFQFGAIPDFPALDALYLPLFRSAAPDNHMAYRSDDVDRLLSGARQTLDDTLRARVFADVERRVVADLPVLPLLWYRSAVALDPRLQPAGDDPVVDGLGTTAFRTLRFEQV